VAGIIA
jgi:hypothetical protein